MLGKRLWIAVLFVVTMLLASAVAQDEKNELGGILGRTFISNQGITGGTYPNHVISFGNGLSFDVEYARRFLVTPVYAVSGEVVLMYNNDEDINGGVYGFAVVPPQLSELFVTPAVRLNLFPTTAVSPWVSVGGGFGHISQSSQAALWRYESWHVYDVRCVRGRTRSRREGLAEAQHPRRSSRLLVWGAGLSAGSTRERRAAAQFLCWRRCVLAVLGGPSSLRRHYYHRTARSPTRLVAHGGLDFFIQFRQTLYILGGISEARGLVDLGKARDRLAKPAVFDLLHELLGGLRRRFFQSTPGHGASHPLVPHGSSLFRRALGMRPQPLFVQQARDAAKVSEQQKNERRFPRREWPSGRANVPRDPGCGVPTSAWKRSGGAPTCARSPTRRECR